MDIYDQMKPSKISLDGKGLSLFAASARDEVKPAIQLVVRELCNRAQATLSGTAPAVLPAAPPALLPAPPPPPTASYFSLQNLKFVDTQGQQRRVPRSMVVELTERQAANALRADIVCKLDDPRVQQLRKQAVTQQPPEPWHCFDLDSGEPPSGDPNLWARRSSTGGTVFERVDRGPPRTMVVPKGDVADKAAVNARSVDDVQER
jgi:hypothetical protein